MRICDLKNKEVINECSCKRLGYVTEMIFDLCGCCITHIIVPGEGRICGLFGHDTEYIIPCRCIKQVGEDIILVMVNEEEVLEKCKY